MTNRRTWAYDEPGEGVEIVLSVPWEACADVEAEFGRAFRLVRCRDCSMYEGCETSGGHVGACFQGGLVRETDPDSFCSEGVPCDGRNL